MLGKDGPVKKVQWVGADNNVVVITAAGEIDLHQSNAFQQSLMEPLEQNPSRVVVDLSEVSYMDSSGVASLVKLLSRAMKQGIDVRLAGLNERVRSIFEITRLDTVFGIYPTVEEAVVSE
ncbi:MAG: STAS domain-containing protein [Planctomycetes bacterium]|nr:STAS domain-containing protein [Planctomycetota bacterium]